VILVLHAANGFHALIRPKIGHSGSIDVPQHLLPPKGIAAPTQKKPHLGGFFSPEKILKNRGGGGGGFFSPKQFFPPGGGKNSEINLGAVELWFAGHDEVPKLGAFANLIGTCR